MSNTIHTPLPWRADGQQIVAQENGYCVAVVSSPHPRARGKERMEDLEYCRGNVAFIVAACNAYEGMRQDLSDARTGWEQATEEVREAEEVLAKDRALRSQLAEALHNLEVSANTLRYCYDNCHGNFGAALTQLAADAERARAALAAAEAA